MMRLRIAVATLSAVTIVAPLAAQQTCDFDPRKLGYQLGAVALLIPKHDQQPSNAEKMEVAKQAIRALTDNPKRFRNEPVRNFLLGQVYVRWYLDQGQTPALRAKRGDVGFSDDRDGDFFLPSAMDTAMSLVEREKPACSDSTARYRNALFNSVLNTGIANFNAKSYDAAIEFASGALQINARSPQMGTALQALAKSSPFAGNLAVGISALEQAIPRLGSDAASVPTRASATFTLATLVRDQAAKLDGSAMGAGLRRAAELFKAAADLAPNGPNAGAAMQAYARAVKDAGDAGAVASVYADMMASPEKYTALQLFEAGVQSVNDRKLEDAARLYEAGLKKNAGYRDALFNLANVYFALHQPDQMAPVVDRLRSIDPLNPDVLQLAGAVWQERGRLSADPGVKKAAQDSVAAFLSRASALPARVRVLQFTVGSDNVASLKGSLENLGSAAGNFTVVFDLLDDAGAIVASVTIVAENVVPKVVREFGVQAIGAVPVAWRYSLR